MELAVEFAVLLAALLMASGAGLACSGPDRAAVKPPPAPRVAVVKTVAPSDFAGQSRRHDQALIPGTDRRGRSTILPLVGRHNQVRVDAVGSGQAERLAPVWLTTAPDDSGRLRVAAADVTSDADPAWRAAVWTAWLSAASAINKNMSALRVTAEAEASQHGGPVSALIAAGFLASVTGRAVDPTVTLLGVVNPDGTLGPVRDVAARIELAARAGKRRVGYPAGMAGGGGDVQALARDLGVDARALGDMGDAYALLTGGELPAPVAAAVSDMDVSPAEVAHLDAGYQAWRALVSRRWADVVELTGAGEPPRAGDRLGRLARAARAEATAAEASWQRGQLALAHDRMARAAMLATATAAIWRVIERVQAGDLAGARQRLDELLAAAPDDPVRAALAAVARFEPDSLADHLLLIAATQSALRGHALSEAVATELARHHGRDGDAPGAHLDLFQDSDAGAGRVLARIAPLILLRARADTESRAAVQMLAAPRAEAPAYALRATAVRRLAREYAAVAAAELDAFEAMFVPRLADSSSAPDRLAERALMVREPHYLLAREAVSWPRTRAALWRELSTRPDRPAPPALLLASGVLAYFEASVLMSTWVSLGVRADQATGLAEALEPDVPLADLLARAERAARQHAFAARVATGGVPYQARISYQVARRLAGEEGPDHGHAQSHGDATARRLRALELFWASSVTSRLAVALARNASP